MIELFLSSDGKHTVHVSADTPEQLLDLVPAAKVLYREVVAEFGGKAQPLSEATPPPSNDPAAVGQRINTEAQAQAAVTPHCPVHKTAMRYRKGRYGDFWSCHTRKPDGRWCDVTYEVTPQHNGQSHAA
jgi:hypothetical protein